MAIHSQTALEKLLRAQLAETGFLSMAEYMAARLHHPQHGYYRTAQPLGREGDFITAPEISPVFGEMLGLWAAQQWQNLGSPARFTLLECGAGSGQLMQDVLRAAGKLEGFLEAAEVVLLEINPLLKQQQAAKLTALKHPPLHAPTWLEDLSTEPLPAQPLILLANEFLDALPIRQLIWQHNAWHEHGVGLNADGAWQAAAGQPVSPSQFVAAHLPQTPPQQGNVVELCEDAAAIVTLTSQHLAQHGGAALWVDYGHAKSGYGQTVQALRAHEKISIFEHIGQADLTAHVNFAAMHHAATQAGCSANLATQSSFLRHYGIELRTALLAKHAKRDEAAQRVCMATERLIAPDKMGELFKVMQVTAMQGN